MLVLSWALTAIVVVSRFLWTVLRGLVLIVLVVLNSAPALVLMVLSKLLWGVLRALLGKHRLWAFILSILTMFLLLLSSGSAAASILLLRMWEVTVVVLPILRAVGLRLRISMQWVCLVLVSNR